MLQLQKDNELSIEELRKMYGGGSTTTAVATAVVIDSSSSSSSSSASSASSGAIKVPAAEEEEDPKEKRIDTANGCAYTKKQFFKYYKNYEKWALAEKASSKKKTKKNSKKNSKVPTRSTSRQRKQVKAFVAGPASYRVRGGFVWWRCVVALCGGGILTCFDVVLM